MAEGIVLNATAILSKMGYTTNSLQINVICPCCGRKKAYINTQNGLWDCKSASCDSGNGGNIVSFYAYAHKISTKEAFKELIADKDIKAFSSAPISSPQSKTISLPIEEIDKTLRIFLSLCSLSQKHYNDLIGRGFSREGIKHYMFKTMPSYEATFKICESLIQRGCKLKGVAGFFTTSKGSWMFATGKGGIIVPQFDMQGRIWGLQIRKDDETLTGGEQKCSWFSSSNKPNGIGATTRINYACDYKLYPNGKRFPYIPSRKVLLTEGGMKADLIHELQPSWSVISVPGVNALKYLSDELKYLKVIGVTDIVHCYDMDYKSNPDVKAAMDKARNLILQNGLKYHFAEWSTLTDDGRDCLKGLDDYLAYKLKGIIR